MRYVARILYITGDIEEKICNTEDEAYKICKDYVKIFGDQVEYTHVRPYKEDNK